MSPEQKAIQGQAIFMAACIVAFLVLCSALTVFNWLLAARGRLDRNAFVGIRLPNSARSQAAWAAAHHVGLRWAPLYVLFNLGVGTALWEPARHDWRLAIAFIGAAGLCVLLLMICSTLYFANRAAAAVDASSDPEHARPRNAPGEVARAITR